MSHTSRGLFVLIIIAILGAGCGAPAAPPQRENDESGAGGTMVRALTSEPARIDPQGTPSSGLSLVLPYLFDTLVVRDEDGDVHPLLAKDWAVSEDGTKITFNLKEGVTFHDGTPFNAEAVRFTFERFEEAGRRSPIYGGVSAIAEIEVVDELTVRFVFDEPTATLWSTISMPYAAIISPASARQAEESGEGNLVGTGPFMLESWESGQSITMKRNPDYDWGPPMVENQGPPHLEKMVYNVIPDATTQLAALQSGDVDVLFVNRPAHRQQLAEDESIRLEEALLSSLVYLGFNCQKPPFDEVAVRQALSHAVDKEEVVNVALDGMGQRAFAPLPPAVHGFDPSLEAYELGYDPEKAKELLREAGFEQTGDGTWARDGERLEGTLLTSTRAPNEAIATLLQSQLQTIGVPMEIQQLDARAVMQATGEGQFDFLLWRYDWNDSSALNIFLSSQRIGRTNRVAYGNPEVDALLEKGVRELDKAARKEIYVEAQQIILQDAPWQPLYNPVSIIAISERIEGAKVGYMGRLLVNDARVVEQ